MLIQHGGYLILNTDKIVEAIFHQALDPNAAHLTIYYSVTESDARTEQRMEYVGQQYVGEAHMPYSRCIEGAEAVELWAMLNAICGRIA